MPSRGEYWSVNKTGEGVTRPEFLPYVPYIVQGIESYQDEVFFSTVWTFDPVRPVEERLKQILLLTTNGIPSEKTLMKREVALEEQSVLRPTVNVIAIIGVAVQVVVLIAMAIGQEQLTGLKMLVGEEAMVVRWQAEREVFGDKSSTANESPLSVGLAVQRFNDQYRLTASREQTGVAINDIKKPAWFEG